MFYSVDRFPQLKVFEDNFEAIKKELLVVMRKQSSQETTWLQERPELVETVTNGWKSFVMRFFTMNYLPNLKACPTIQRIVETTPGLVTVEFSLLSADTHILPHTGFTDKVWRAHLGLIIPKGDVGIRVEDTIQGWEEGKVIVFDDSKEHETWNKTNEDRIVLMFDFVEDFSADTAKEVSKEILEITNDPFTFSIASKQKWLEWLEIGEIQVE